MKRTILFLLAATTTFSCLYAQTAKNPFSQLGYKKHIYYTSSKGEFEEFHGNPDVVEIGSVYFNTKTKKVVGYVNEEKENAEVATATPAMSVDPLCEKYYWITPYAYCLNNPVKFVDPDGQDPIYAKNFWGKVKLIGDDGQKSTGSYLVKGSVARDVKATTKAGNYYTGNLSESKNVMHVPTGQIQQDVQQTASATLNSGATPDTRVENGGHALTGDANARIWDSGNPVQISTDANGNTTKTWSVTPFKIGGKKNQVGGPASSIKYIWHIHPNGSTPSDADYSGMSNWRENGFTGNTFLIDVNNGTVTFFNEKGTLTSIKYSDFIKMGKQEVIK